ncbi:MAG: hypothetical protein Q7S37_04705 [bacterium]|nr:hypothetical protein [bacterium]
MEKIIVMALSAVKVLFGKVILSCQTAETLQEIQEVISQCPDWRKSLDKVSFSEKTGLSLCRLIHGGALYLQLRNPVGLVNSIRIGVIVAGDSEFQTPTTLNLLFCQLKDRKEWRLEKARCDLAGVIEPEPILRLTELLGPNGLPELGETLNQAPIEQTREIREFLDSWVQQQVTTATA